MEFEEFLLARIQDVRKKISRLPLDLYNSINDILKNQEYVVMAYCSWPVLAESEPVISLEDRFEDNTLAYKTSQTIQWLTVEEYKKKFGTQPPPAPMIRQMLLTYRDHPYFDPSWIGE